MRNTNIPKIWKVSLSLYDVIRYLLNNTTLPRHSIWLPAVNYVTSSTGEWVVKFGRRERVLYPVLEEVKRNSTYTASAPHIRPNTSYMWQAFRHLIKLQIFLSFIFGRWSIHDRGNLNILVKKNYLIARSDFLKCMRSCTKLFLVIERHWRII